MSGQEGIRSSSPARTWQPRRKWPQTLRTRLRELWVCAGLLRGPVGGGGAGFEELETQDVCFHCRFGQFF